MVHYYHDKYIKSNKVVGNGNNQYHCSISGLVCLNIKNDKNILHYLLPLAEQRLRPVFLSHIDLNQVIN